MVSIRDDAMDEATRRALAVEVSTPTDLKAMRQRKPRFPAPPVSRYIRRFGKSVESGNAWR